MARFDEPHPDDHEERFDGGGADAPAVDTEVDDEELSAADIRRIEAAAFTGYPARTKLVIAAVLAVAAVVFVLAGLRVQTDDASTVAVSGTPGQVERDVDGIEVLVPRPDAEILAQQPVGIDLAPGWRAELRLRPANSPPIDIPVEQLTITPELAQYLFFAGEDQVVSRLPGGTNCLTATYWDQVRGRAASEQTKTWCFSVA